jgi:SAM-dependent methyltransferase
VYDKIEEKINDCLNIQDKSNYYFTRYKCYKDIENFLSSEDSANKKCLSVSSSNELCKIIGIDKTEIVSKDYPDLDLGNIFYKEDEFDFVVSDFVIEHCEADPLTIFKEQSRILKKGGYLVCTTAFVYPYHACTKDLWRFNNDTYEFLCNKTGLEIQKSSSWGSLECLIAINKGVSWHLVPNTSCYLQDLANADSEYKIVTWLIAKKI